MSRRQRLHIPGGVYYVLQRGRVHQPIFSQADDYALFERLLATALRRTDARVHAYCWTPTQIHLLVQIQETPVGRLMQGLTSRYARSMHERAGESGHFFKQRYRAVLIDPDNYLLKLTRFIHRVPERTGMAGADLVHTSHSAYLRESVVPWLTTRSVLRLLDSREELHRYVEFMSDPLAAEDLELFDRAGSSDLRVIGSPEFIAGLPRHVRTYRTRASLDQIIHTVTSTLGLEREHVLSSSRQRELTLARALIAWYATERGVATLSEVARRMHRDPSTLSMAISRYRVCRPELFKLTALHDIVPLAPVGLRPMIEGWESSAQTRDQDSMASETVSAPKVAMA